MMDLKATYNRIARDWVKDHSADTWWVGGTDKFLSFLKDGASILDAGCGGGVKTEYLMNKGYNVLGIDFSEEMIAIARKKVPGAKFEIRDIRQPLEMEQKFDGIFAQAVLLHIPKQEAVAVMRNLTACLNQGGYLYLAVKEHKPGQAEEEIKQEDDYGYHYQRFFSYYTLDEIKQYLNQLGLALAYESVTLSGNTNWIQVIAKK